MTRERVVLDLTEAGPGASGLLEAARTAGFRSFVGPDLPSGDRRAGERWYVRTAEGFRPVDRERTGSPIRVLSVLSPSDLASADRRGRREGSVGLRLPRDRVIPLEGLLSMAHGRYSVWIVTDRSRHLPAALGALEVGAERAVIEIASRGDLARVVRQVPADPTPTIRWSRGRVLEVEPAGISERVLVDTTTLLEGGEGFLLGSSAAHLFHVVSEARGSSFSRPRPFRVNAGSPHLYVLMADGTTRYLSELRAGDRVLALSPRAPARSVVVGRLKIERRPMALLRARHPGGEGTVFVQEAETVRLSGPGAVRPITDLRRDDPLLIARLPPARHLGREVAETIEER